MWRRILLYTLAIANFVAIVGIWWSGSSLLFQFGGALIAFGRLLGLLAEFSILVQLVLISRLPIIEHAFGFDKVNKLHRAIGITLVSTILLHPLFLIVGYMKEHEQSFWAQILDFLFNWPDVWKAAVGLGIVLVVGFFSAPWIRRRMRYESWHLIHLLMYVAIGFFIWHQTNFADVSSGGPLRYWLILNYSVFGLLIIYRWLRPLWLFWYHDFRVEKTVQETYNVTSVYITGRHLEKFTFEAGQYMNVLFLQKGLREPHPFSISIAPGNGVLRQSIKAVGDFTKKIETLKPGTRVIIDGPLGRFTEAAATKKKFLCIAGGIGITPIRALIETLVKKGSDVILLFGNRTEQDIVFQREFDALGVKMVHVLSQEGDASHEHGYIDLEKIERLVPDYKDRDIYVCGPPVMMNGIIALLKKAGVPRHQLHFEKFSF